MNSFALIISLFFALWPAGVQKEAPGPDKAGSLPLPAPQHRETDGLDRALLGRQSSRAFAQRPLDLQVLSNLLWATMGINRPATGKRVWPSSRNVQDLKLILLVQGRHYRYDPLRHALISMPTEGIPEALKTQPFVEGAPVHLLFCSDSGAYPARTPENARIRSAFFHAGCASQNASLFCSAQGLATLVRTYFDPEALKKELALRPQEEVLVHQMVGHSEP